MARVSAATTAAAGGEITITGGTVHATGGIGAGISGGWISGNGGEITISGGRVKRDKINRLQREASL